MQKISCSAAILTLNNAGTLGRCLESIKDFTEIILLDGNSTDKTQEIGRTYGAKIYQQQETNEPNIRITDFTAMRLKSLALTTQPWMFWIDSDEYVSEELHQEIQRITADPNSDPMTCYLIPRKAVVDGRVIEHAFFYPDQYVRLFSRKSGVTFKPGKRVHEKVLVPDGVRVVTLTGCTYAPWPSNRELMAKDRHYLELIAADLNGAGKNRMALLRVAAINLLKAGYIVLKIVRLHLRHGFCKTLPLRHNLRFIRYHLAISQIWFVRSIL